jgi:hypothetical protein
MSDKPLDYQSSQSPDATRGASAHTARENSFVGALKRVLRQPAFVVAAGLLLVAAIGLNAAVGSLKLHFKKEPVPLKHELGTIPARLGSWVQVSQDKALDKEVEDALGTEKYIFRWYVDESQLHPGIADDFKDKDEKQRDAALSRIIHDHPGAAVNLSVTYYTGMVDTVAHVPDRCVTASGYEPKSYTTPMWPIGANLPASKKVGGKDNIEVRFINFEDQTGSGNVPRSIAYFFNTNGKFISSPLGVRQELANLFEKRGYYAKIECMTTEPDTTKSAGVLKDFLTAALPEIEKCMPEWK